MRERMSAGDPEKRCYSILADLTGRFLGLLASIPTGHTNAPIPHLTWTVGECARHVLSLYRRMTDDPRRASDPADVARLNDIGIREIGDGLAAIAAETRERHSTIMRLAEQIDPARTFPFHAGQQVTYATAAAIVAGELVVHGDDIARSLGMQWQVTLADVELVWRVAVPVLQGWLRPDGRTVREVWVLRMAGLARPVVVHLDQGRLTVTDHEPMAGAARVHHVDVDDPVAFTLGFPYRRRPLIDPSATRLAEIFYPV